LTAVAELRILVSARAENVALLRRAVSGLGDALGLEQSDLGDLQTIVTEAAMNVVQHAYEDSEGPLEMAAGRRGDSLEVAIRDRGFGFRPRPADPGRGDLRLGLPLIAALSDGFEISGQPGQGTEVRVRKLIVPGPAQARTNGAAEVPQATSLSFGSDAPAAAVLSPVIGMLASRADLSIDRLADSQILGDAVSATPVGEFTDERMDIEIIDREGCLEIRVGPLVSGAAERLLKEMELPGLGSLRALASRVEVEPAGEGAERLLISIDDPRESPPA
jgi:anti-sigma regulatory factor (Ser/Thr protein kinase)